MIICSLIPLQLFFLGTVSCLFANYLGCGGAAVERRGERLCLLTGKLLNLEGAVSGLESEMSRDLLKRAMNKLNHR